VLAPKHQYAFDLNFQPRDPAGPSRATFHPLFCSTSDLGRAHGTRRIILNAITTVPLYMTVTRLGQSLAMSAGTSRGDNLITLRDYQLSGSSKTTFQCFLLYRTSAKATKARAAANE
jgi:hypothetical protein